ncbi:amino acid transporter [Allocatelliglobosispora scoriae]|uniref:Amino acid transporter n=1 Tax=Allocatelliglobosispora scoriae TaxID=643052 RepID=A0A841BX13_9ACTN|nr:APC family permease [Allocatelliglobosispora scoriae]MBB5872694.1 amino acid transporter [Allocatelliglobosispora scoriae]
MASPFLADSNLEQFGYTQELRRTLRLPDLIFYGMVFMVPIAPFAIFGNVFQVSGGMVALAYLAGMLAMMITAASYFQMVKAFPMSGSVYTYAGRGIAPSVGFLAGWAILLDYILAPCLLYVVAATSLHAIWPILPIWGYLAAFIVVNTIINYLGIRLTASFIKVFLIAELAVLGLFLVLGGWALAQGKGRGFTLDPIFNSATFSWGVLFAAVSVAVLSFLGFDGISMLSEETRSPAKHIGRAMALALLLAGLLFIAQSWVASLLVPDPAGLLANGDPNGSAFYDTAAVIAGNWLQVLTAVATAIAWGIADSLVAQVATSRLLYAMARDRQMPSFLARVSARRGVPTNSVLLVGVVSLVLGLYMSTRADGILLLANLVNFGAVIAFLTLHLSVIWHYMVRKRSNRIFVHLILPLVGFGILVGVVWNARLLAQQIGGIWLGVGVIVLIGLYVFGRRPALAGLAYAGSHR